MYPVPYCMISQDYSNYSSAEVTTELHHMMGMNVQSGVLKRHMPALLLCTNKNVTVMNALIE